MTMKNIFQKLQVNETLVKTYLQIYRELLALVMFAWVHSNSEEVSYLSWQNTYPNLKTTCFIKLKFLSWTKLLENLLLARYLYGCCCAFNSSDSKIYIVKFLFTVENNWKVLHQWQQKDYKDNALKCWFVHQCIFLYPKFKTYHKNWLKKESGTYIIKKLKWKWKTC